MAIEFLNGIKIPAGEINLKGITIERASGSGADGFDNDALGSYILSATDGSWGAGTKPPGSHNGVGILSFQTHSGKFYTQLALSTSTNDLFIRSADDTTTFGSYNRLWNDSHFSTTSVTNWDTAYTYSQATHAPTDAEANVQANWTETTTTSDAFIQNKPTTFAPSAHNHDDRYYTETEINAQNVTLNETLAALRGWVPGFSNPYDSSLTWDRTEDALKIKSDTDNSIGAVYKAMRVLAGMTIRVTVTVKGDVAGSNGLYLRLQKHDGDMPDGKTHVSHDSGNSSEFVQEEDSEITSWYENSAISTDWVTHEKDVTITSDGYISFLVLNWTGNSTNSIWVKNPDIQIVAAADSDKLDGQEGTHYLDYNNFTNKPTIPSGNSILDWTADQGSTNINANNIVGYINTTEPNESFNPFAGQKLHDGVLTNALVGRHNRFVVTIDGTTEAGASYKLSNQNFEEYNQNRLFGTSAGETRVFNINVQSLATGSPSSNGITYSAGFFDINFYSSPFPASWSARVKNRDGNWYNVTNLIKVGSSKLRGVIPIGNWLTDIEFTLTARTSAPFVTGNVTYGISEFEIYFSRMAASQGGNISSIGGYLGGVITTASGTTSNNWNSAYNHSQATHAPTDAEANVQADWTETTTTSDAFILNKPSTFPPSSHNHDDRYYTETESNAKFTSTDGSGKEWIFEISDESHITGNKWYKVATVNKGNGGLHIRGLFSNHVEGFAAQKVDLGIVGREGNVSDNIEITGQVDVLHNATGSEATDNCGIRIIESDITSSAYYHYFDVYVKTTRYQMLRLHLTKSGATDLHTSAGSNAVTTEPSPVSGGTTGVELDTSTLAEGNYVVDNSTPREIFHEGHKPTFAEIDTTPTTLAGYGITDAAPSTVVNQSDFVSAATGGNFGGNLSVHTGAGTGSLSVGRTSDQSIKLYITDVNNSITAAQDSDGNQEHNFILNRTFAGTGANNFKIQKGGADQLSIDSNGQVTIPGDLIVNGTTITLNTATVEVEDNIIQLNTTQGTPNTATAATSGISIFRGLDSEGNDTITQASLIFNESSDTWNLTNNLVVAGNISAANLSGTNTGDQDLSGYKPINGQSPIDINTGYSARTGTWSTGNSTAWGPPNITGGYAYNDGTGSITFDVPTGMESCWISHLTWSSGGYVDVLGVQSDGGEVFLRRINTHQAVQNSDEGAGQHDGSTVTFAGTSLSSFGRIKFQNKVGRFHFTGIAFSSSQWEGTEGTGMIHPAQITQQGSGNGLDADKLDGQQGTYYLDYNNFSNKPTIPTDFVSAANGGTFSGALKITDALNTGSPLLDLHNSTNGESVEIKFTDVAAGTTQFGNITYRHQDSKSYGSAAGFTIGSAEASTTILADGKLMYKEGIYSKPATGTGAGTRRDSNWNTAYTHSQATHAPTDAEANVQANWTATSGDAFILNKPSTFAPSAHNHDGDYIQDGGTTAIGDINTIGTESIKHRWNNVTTGRPAAPQSNEYGTVTTLTYDSSYATQLAWDIHAGNLYGRTLDVANDTGTWKRFALSTEIPTDFVSAANGGTFSGAISTPTGSTFAGAIKITEAGTAQHILIGNQDSSGVDKPAMIRGVNGQLKLGYGDAWTGEGGTMTVGLTLDTSSNATFAGQITGQDSGSVQLELKRTSSGTNGNTSIKFLQPLGDGYLGVNSSGALSFSTHPNLDVDNKFKVDRSGNATFAGSASFAGKVDFQGDAAIEGGSGYGVFKGYTGNDNHFISVRGVVANTSTTTITGGHQTTFVEHADSTSEGWYFKSKTTGTYREIARIDGTNQMYLGGNKVWNAGNDGSGSGLDADTVDGSHANHSYGAGRQYDFTVNGNADIFYPVVLNGFSGARMTRLTVFRGYSEPGPNTWNTASHKGGLTLDMDVRVGGWGGYPNMINVHDFGEIYSRICGGAYYTAHTMKFVIWLRGGGATYHMDSPNSNLSIEVNDSTSNANYVNSNNNGTWYSYNHSNNAYDVTVSARDLSAADAGAKSLLAYMPIRYNGSQNKVISGVSQPTSLDATTVDGINSTSFLRSDANDSASGNINFSGAIGMTSTNNTLNGHLYYNAYDAAGNHYPHFKDGSANGGTTINWRQYYGNTYKTHTWSSDSSGNMVSNFDGEIQGNGLRIDGDSNFIGHVNVGSASDTSNRDLYLHGSTANKKSRLRTTNGNLHVDSAEGHALYLNYYYGASTNIYFGSGNGGSVGSISSSGLLRMANDVVAYYSFSDKRLKTDIKSTEGNLEKILSLNPVEYTWKEGPRKGVKEIGLIAQEVEEIVPEVVRVQSRHDNETGDGIEYKQVDYEHLVSTLIGAMQEQQKQIDELKSQISVLNIKNCKCKK